MLNNEDRPSRKRLSKWVMKHQATTFIQL